MSAAHRVVDAFREAGMSLSLTAHGSLRVEPASKLTPELRELVSVYKPEVVALLSANDETPDPDRWCWPHSAAMNGAEIALMQRRIEIFERRGLKPADAESLADELVPRDREGDDRHVCLECSQLRKGMRCASPSAAFMWREVGAVAQLPQRCPAFEAME